MTYILVRYDKEGMPHRASPSVFYRAYIAEIYAKILEAEVMEVKG